MAYNLIGKDFTPPDVRAKVTGSAKYAEDIRAEGMVFARLLTSPMPHGRVTRIDTSAALAMEGVIGVITADDEGADGLLTNEPKFVGDLILALAATDETTAQDAIDAITLDIEPLEFTVDPLESLYPGGPNGREDGTNVGGGRSGLDPHQIKWTAQDFAAVEDGQLPFGEPAVGWSFGDVEAGLAEAELIYDESFTTQGNSHHSMEPRTAMAWWENGKCFVHAGCQSLTATLTSLARQCGVELENLVYVNEFCGGGFGSKGTAAQTAGIAARLSKKINRPVLLRISRHEEFYIGSARGTLQGRVRMGFRADGRITAIDFSVVQDGGANGGFGDSVDAAQAVSIIYQPLAMRFRGIPVVTNTTPRGPQRGPGQNQIAAALEPFMDRAAGELGLDPLAIRRINAPTNEARVGGNQIPVTSAYMPEALDRGAEMFDWQAKRQLSGRRNGLKGLRRRHRTGLSRRRPPRLRRAVGADAGRQAAPAQRCRQPRHLFLREHGPRRRRAAQVRLGELRRPPGHQYAPSAHRIHPDRQQHVLDHGAHQRGGGLGRGGKAQGDRRHGSGRFPRRLRHRRSQGVCLS